MDLITLVRPFQRNFYLLGQTLPLEYYLCEKRGKRSKAQQISMMFPTVFMCLLKSILCMAFILLVDLYVEMVNIAYDLMSDVFVLCEMAKIFAVAYQNFAHCHLIGDILRNFQTVEILFQSALNHPIEFASFKRIYMTKLYWAFGSYTALVAMYIVYYFHYEDVDMYDVFIRFIQFTSISIYMHVLLFIDLVTYFLRHLNETIAKENNDRASDEVIVFVVKQFRTTNMIRQRLSKYKFIHFRLWKTTQQINEFFGWTLITILLQSFVEFVYDSIWQLQILYDFWNIGRISRKTFVSNVNQ